MEFNERSGMASSSRAAGHRIVADGSSRGDKEKTARMLFFLREIHPAPGNFPAPRMPSASFYPGLNRLDYRGEYWPSRITSVHDEKILSWLETRLHLVTLEPRKSDFRVRKDTRITPAGVHALGRRGGMAAGGPFYHEMRRNLDDRCALHSKAQVRMFPKMMKQQRPVRHQTIC